MDFKLKFSEYASFDEKMSGRRPQYKNDIITFTVYCTILQSSFVFLLFSQNKQKKTWY